MRFSPLLALALACLSSSAHADGSSTDANAEAPAPDTILADGTVMVRSFPLPPSSYLSEAAVAELPRKPVDQIGQLDQLLKAGRVPQVRPMIPQFMSGQIDALKALYGTTTEVGELGGVPAVFFEPAGGIPEANRGKVLLNLPGGGFIMGHAGGTGSLESIPLAAIAGVRIVSITYRQAPEHVFPAASEDVEAAYRALLKDHKPEDIAIFGCSAGGLLGAQAIAWFAEKKLPQPAALGVFCAGMGASFGGDSAYWNRPFEAIPPRQSGSPYFSGADLESPLVSPMLSPETLASFPPTLFITASRAFEMSEAAYSHRKLIEAGGESQLLIWDGLGHAFFYNPKMPEAREAFDAQARFFARHLGLALPAVGHSAN